MHDPRIKDLPECVALLQQKGIPGNEQVLMHLLAGLVQNQWHTYTLFAGQTPVERRRGGGAIAVRPSLPLRFVGEVRMQTTNAMGVPAQRWTNTTGAIAQRNYLPVFDPVVVDSIVGVVHVESMRDQSQIRQHVWLTRTAGSGVIPARHLIGVTVRFLRHRENDNGKFGVNIYAVAPEGVNASGDATLPGSESVFESTEVVLSPALQADYDTLATPRGAGVKLLFGQLGLFAR